MTKLELEAKVAAEGQITKASAGRIIDYIGRVIIADLLLDGKANYPGLGIFTVVTRAPRACINPQNGQSVGVKPAYKTIKFKPFKEVKEKLV
jgi:DNA-binding protein HU-beta